MAWIESHQTLRNHPKTIKLKQLLQIEKAKAVGILHFLWWWSIDYAPDGDLTKYDDVQIAEACEWNGDPIAFVASLVESGFLERTENSIQIHDWKEFCGPLMDRRLKRMAAKRLQMEAKRPPMVDKRPPTQPNPTQPTRPNHIVVFQSEEQFEILWKKYPNKDGRKAAWKHFKASVKNEENFGIINTALNNYLESDKVKKGYIKNGSTWFNNWRDWVNKPKSTDIIDPNVSKILRGFRNRLGARDDPEWEETVAKLFQQDAVNLLEIMARDTSMALSCIDDVVDWLESKNLSWKPKTIVEHAVMWKHGKITEEVK